MPTTPVIYMETDFQEKADEILSRARRASSLSLRSPYVRYAEARLAELVQASLELHTPVATMDQWRHTRGTLKASTDVLVESRDTSGGESAQYVISATQDAKNPTGTEYAPFVILGHRTRGSGGRPISSERRWNNIGWVTENPYPSASMEAIEPEVFEVLDLLARQIAESTVQYLTEGTGL